VNPAESLRQAFTQWGLPVDATVFLLKIWDAIQFLDDVKDGHPVSNVDAGIYTLIVGIPSDDFLARNRPLLSGALVTAYHKWQAANVLEAQRRELDKCYMWRAGYYDLVMLVVSLCLPREETEVIAPKVLALYGESREDYLQEMGSA
jgi:hypothetical protein